MKLARLLSRGLEPPYTKQWIFWLPPTTSKLAEVIHCTQVMSVRDIRRDGCYWLDETTPFEKEYPYCW